MARLANQAAASYTKLINMYIYRECELNFGDLRIFSESVKVNIA